jgi:GNAT superfamily N-acetyltransferase
MSDTYERSGIEGIACRKMDASLRRDASKLLNIFLREDEHYLASSAAYGDRGPPALERALDLFLRRPELGFVWLAYSGEEAIGVCVICYAISTSIGGLVAKLDDVFVIRTYQRLGVATEMVGALAEELRREGVRRIDTSVYVSNLKAESYYLKLGFKPLGEERLALVL